jgi:hypothetical protein
MKAAVKIEPKIVLDADMTAAICQWAIANIFNSIDLQKATPSS